MEETFLTVFGMNFEGMQEHFRVGVVTIKEALDKLPPEEKKEILDFLSKDKK